MFREYYNMSHMTPVIHQHYHWIAHKKKKTILLFIASCNIMTNSQFSLHEKYRKQTREYSALTV